MLPPRPKSVWQAAQRCVNSVSPLEALPGDVSRRLIRSASAAFSAVLSLRLAAGQSFRTSRSI
jgi:hypothetical protein